jgi:predicted HD phosphohydrolase
MAVPTSEQAPLVNYTRLEDATRADILRIDQANQAFYAATADRVLDYFATLQGEVGTPISTREHCLQTATRALRAGADAELIVAALLHDIGEPLAPHNHAEVAAAILRPFVSESTYWVLTHHALFEGYYYFHHLGRDRNERDRFRTHPDFAKTVDFCEQWDQRSFDPHYDTLSVDAFVPYVRQIFSRTPWSITSPVP